MSAIDWKRLDNDEEFCVEKLTIVKTELYQATFNTILKRIKIA